jgi:transcriptional regulator with XRE-family HTH domain
MNSKPTLGKAMAGRRMKDNLKELRERAKLTQQDLAIAAGLSVSAVTQIEQGINTEPRLTTIKKLARALGVTSDELIGMDSDAASKRRKKGGGA